MTPADAIGKLAEHGTLGLLLGVALWVIYKLYSTNQASNAARVAAADSFLEKQERSSAASLEKATRMVEACTAAITAQTTVTVGHDKGLRELKELFEEYVEEVRRGSR